MQTVAPGRGRPKDTPLGSKRVMISIPNELVEDFKALGGSRWVQEQIIKAVAKAKRKAVK